jgi:hypothetical protein
MCDDKTIVRPREAHWLASGGKMSNGDGGISIGGFTAFCFFCYVMSFMGIPIGLALIGDALLWGWYIFLFIFGLVAALSAYGFVAQEAIKTQDRWLMFDLVVAPLVTVWPAVLCREPVRDFFVSAYQDQGAAVLISALLFVFLILGLPLGIMGMLVGEASDGGSRGPAGTVVRLFTSYLPLFLFYAAWVAIILNTVDPKK